jgi:hypothetical protein
MKHIFLVAAITMLAVAAPAAADSRIKIDTVPATYKPVMSSRDEPVYLSGFHFEVNEETRRARIVATYNYAENMIVGEGDGGGPRWTIVQIPGLVYDAQNHAVVYDSDGKHTVCAVFQESKGFWGRRSKLKSTGSCTVSTEPADVTVDDGWGLHHLQVINAYFEVH